MNKLSDVASIIISIFAVGVLLAGLILSGQVGIRDDIADLQQRTARIEGQLALLIEAVNLPPVPDATE
ncbi:MAG: hypothetical protein OXF58_02020 [Gammaproteobacteria bacterium]|nr:hypothetical protein [Gammaproteobacteria bacterium]